MKVPTIEAPVDLLGWPKLAQGITRRQIALPVEREYDRHANTGRCDFCRETRNHDAHELLTDGAMIIGAFVSNSSVAPGAVATVLTRLILAEDRAGPPALATCALQSWPPEVTPSHRGPPVALRARLPSVRGADCMTGCLEENRLLWLVRGELSGASLDEVEAHLDGCVSCRDLLALVARSSSLPATEHATAGGGRLEPNDELGPGSRVGRFAIASRLGAGAMGVVYAARDDELDRIVAVKLLRPGATDQELLKREAQALARLAHPNVIAVYEVGLHRDHLFLAMEYVAGASLAEWCAQPRPWRAIVEVMAQAGAGLAAAHAAGLIHRDVKPANIRVGVDDRVRMLDFGLAQRTELPGAERPTQVIAGTPAYMAPEQLGPRGRGGALARASADARSDQFAFCVTLYEALYGERPFAGTATRESALREAPRGSRVPAWLRRAILRGLSVDPDARYVDMAGLLRALRPRSRRRLAVVAAVVTVAVAGTTLGAWGATTRVDPCTAGPGELARVWNEPHRRAIQAAFLATGKPFATDAWHAVEATLDRNGQRWVEMHTSTCKATHVRGEQSDELLDLRMQCLADQLGSFDALVRVLETADAGVVARAPAAVDDLPDLERCTDGSALRKRARVPSDEAGRRQLADLRGEVAHAQALYAVGKYREGLALVTSLLPAIHRLGFGPLVASAELERGLFEMENGAYPEADRAMREALRVALAANDEHLAARIAGARIDVESRAGHYAEGIERAKDAAALIQHSGGDDEVQAVVDNQLGVIYAVLGRYPEATAAHTRALAGLERRYGADDSRVALALSALGGLETEQGHYDRAAALQEKALASARARLGNAHPIVASILANLGDTLDEQGQPDAALAYWREALAIRMKALPATHPLIAESLRSIGTALAYLGRPAEARDHAERALAIYLRASDPNRRAIAYCHSVIADALRQDGRYADALAHAQESADLLEKVVGPDTVDLARALDAVGHILTDDHREREALPVERRAVAISEKVLGVDHPDLADPLTGLGLALLGGGDAAAALGPLRRADRLAEASHAEPANRIETRFALARAIWESGGDRTSALVFALAASRGLSVSGTEPVRGVLTRWLISHVAPNTRH